ncbi:MAG TPA: acyl-CoA reductase [Puia sp.]
MDLENRISLLIDVGNFLKSEDPAWSAVKTRTFQHNAWFIPDFIDLSIRQIVSQFLQRDRLESWVKQYQCPDKESAPKKVGVVMAGNIPLVGFHDFLCCFLSGHQLFIKLSSKDPFLFPSILEFLYKKDPDLKNHIQVSTMLRGMDAYIATGSNNSARYFDYYFGKYPSLIRRNRTSIAVVEGNESAEELNNLADDVFQYFGLGCRNVTQIHAPENYDFIPLLQAFGKYKWMADHNKYKNNYDYRLSLAILNKVFYMSNDCILLMENASPFSPIAVLHYSFYKDPDSWVPPREEDNLQCILGRKFLPFGESQHPGLGDYADAADTMKFLRSL